MNICSKLPRLLPALLSAALLAQSSAILTVAPPAKVTARRNSSVEARITVELASGFHVNSNTPTEDYLIPLRLNWEKGPLVAEAVIYPQPRMEKYQFSPKPISVFTGDFEILTKFKVNAAASRGPGILLGKLRYQACNDNACFPPKTVDVKLPFHIQ